MYMGIRGWRWLSSRSMALVALCVVAPLALAAQGCSNKPMALEELRRKNAPGDLERHKERQLAFTAPLTRRDVVSFALEHNLDAALEERRLEIQKELATGAWLKLLPNLSADLDYTDRSELPASASTTLSTGEMSDEFTFSSPAEQRVWSLNMAFNALDFGIAYNQAEQAENRVTLTEQQLRRTRQNLALDVTRAYWRCAVAQRAARRAQPLIEDIEDRLQRLEGQMDAQIVPQRTGLSARKEMLQMLMQLREYAREYKAARTELGQLMGLAPSTDFELDPVEFSALEDYERYDLPALEEEALLSRPELYQQDQEARIARDETHIAMMRLLPSPNTYFKHSWDDNPHLLSHHWHTLGVRAAWDLLSIPQNISGYRIAKMREELTEQRRAAVGVAVLTQVHLALIQYHDAALGAVDAAELKAVQADLVDVTRSMVEQGKASGSDLLNARLDAFFAEREYAQAFAAYRIQQEQIRNSVGRDPRPQDDPLPVTRMVESDVAPEGGVVAELRREAEKLEEDEPTDRPVVESVIERMSRADAEVTPADVAAMMPVAEQLASDDYAEAKSAKKTLVKAGPAGAAAALEMLNDVNQRARLLSILAVRKTGTPKMIASLLPALQDENPDVRYHAALALRATFQKEFGYYHGARPQKRELAIARWREYLFSKDSDAAVNASAGRKTHARSPGETAN